MWIFDQFAAQAAGAVALALRLAEREDRERHLETALRSRSVIDQAMGVLIGQAGITAGEAFQVLRLRSQARNVKLRDIAAEVIRDATSPRFNDYKRHILQLLRPEAAVAA